MLRRCRQTIIALIPAMIIVVSMERSIAYKYIGARRKAISADSDDIRVINAEHNQVIETTIPDSGLSP